MPSVPVVKKVYKKLPPLKKRVADALVGKGGAKGGRRINEDGLNAQQEMFCALFSSDRQFFGNGTQSYIEAYDVTVGKGTGMTSYEMCRFRAHELLTQPNVLKRIDELFESRGLNDQFVDKQLEKLITQDAEFPTKLGAIKEYNALKKRITSQAELKIGVMAVVEHLYKESDKLYEAKYGKNK